MVSNGSERAQGEPSAVGAAPSVQIDRGPRLAPWLSPEPIRFLLALGSRKSTLPALRDDSEKATAGTYGSKQLQQGQQHQRPMEATHRQPSSFLYAVALEPWPQKARTTQSCSVLAVRCSCVSKQRQLTVRDLTLELDKAGTTSIFTRFWKQWDQRCR